MLVITFYCEERYTSSTCRLQQQHLVLGCGDIYFGNYRVAEFVR